jgi:FkbM family methyltransferase
MNFLLVAIKKLNNFKRKKIFHIKTKKISSLFKKINKFEKIQIYDIGAGLRYLPTLLKFDGISKIHLIDPNDNIEISYNNLKKLFLDKKSIKKYKVGISDKSKTIYYYPAKVSSGSSFLHLSKKKNNNQYDEDYFGNEKKLLKKVYDFQTFKRKNNLKNPDIIKIDVEGLEFKILKSIFKENKPLIIEVEVNFDNSIIGDTFLKVNQLIKKNNYKLNTIYPTYQMIKKNSFIKGDYYNPVSRNPLNQSDCYYILNKKEYSLRDIVMLIGYGFIIDAEREFLEIKKKLKPEKIKVIESLIKSLL